MGRVIEIIQGNRFWVGVGLLVLAAVILAAVGYVPLRNANAETTKEVKQQLQEVSRYATDELPNQQSVQRLEELKQQLEGRLQEVRSNLKSQDDAIEKYFEDPEFPGEGPLEGSVWKAVYREKVDELVGKVEAAFLAAPTTPVSRTEFGAQIPDSERMRAEEKRYWIQKRVIDALASLNTAPDQPLVPVFRGFQFMQTVDTLLSPSHAEEFQPIGFQISVGAEFRHVPRVLASLLNSEAPIHITGIAVRRPEQLYRQASIPGGESVTGELMAPGELEAPTGGLEEPGLELDMGDLFDDFGLGDEPDRRQRDQRTETRDVFRGGAVGDVAIPSEVREKLPKNMVTIDITGYVTDYIESDDEATIDPSPVQTGGGGQEGIPDDLLDADLADELTIEP